METYALLSYSQNKEPNKPMTHKPTKWLQMQTNTLQTTEDRLNWTVERLQKIKDLTSLSRGKDLTFDTVLDEVDALLLELESGKMIDRGIVD
jgi:hypothetical protein